MNDNWSDLFERTTKEEMTESIDPEKCKLAAANLMSAFKWSSTPEGVDFWHFVRERLNHMGGIK